MEYAGRVNPELGDLRRAQIADLVVGTRMYLGDPRKTPVTVVDLIPDTATFKVLVDDFEDVGAAWEFAVWDVPKFLVAEQNKQRLPDRVLDALAPHMARLNQVHRLDVSQSDRAASIAKVAEIARHIETSLATFPNLPCDPTPLWARDVACDQWSGALAHVLERAGVSDHEQRFVAHYTSNPHAGEMIKGHRIVLAELGLCPFEGQPVRDPGVFQGRNAKPERARHILTRLAFMRVMFAKLGVSEVPLYRAIYSNQALDPPRNTGFVSASFRKSVALALFEAGQATQASAIFWQRVPVERVFSTYVETPSLSERYSEAEAVLLFDPASKVF